MAPPLGSLCRADRRGGPGKKGEEKKVERSEEETTFYPLPKATIRQLVDVDR
jgi:hypothetical protein